MSVYAHVGPPWTSITTGCGLGPGGSTKNPCTRSPLGLVNHHDSYGLPLGARSPRAATTSSPVARLRTVGGVAPLEMRYQTSPSDRTAAPASVPSGCASAATLPAA